MRLRSAILTAAAFSSLVLAGGPLRVNAGVSPGAFGALVAVPNSVSAAVQKAQVVQAVPASNSMTIGLFLKPNNSAGLQTAIQQQIHNAHTKGGWKLNSKASKAQLLAQYEPTAAQVQNVENWATGAGLTVVGVHGAGFAVVVSGTVATIDSALHTTINVYKGANGKQFFANATSPLVPSGLGIMSIGGLTTSEKLHTGPIKTTKAKVPPTTQNARCVPLSPGTCYTGIFFPKDFRNIYDVANHNVGATTFDGTGETIGLVLWGAPVSNSDLASFASTTGDTLLTGSLTALGAYPTVANHVNWYEVSSGFATWTVDSNVETALDVENAHGMATNSSLHYYLADEAQCPATDPKCSISLPVACTNPVTAGCFPTDLGLELATLDAVLDPTTSVISNSWGDLDATGLALIGDPTFAPILDAFYTLAASVGTTVLDSSGDTGEGSGQCFVYLASPCGSSQFPAEDPNVVTVGGTSLQANYNFTQYQSEIVWNSNGGSTGGGCSTFFTLANTGFSTAPYDFFTGPGRTVAPLNTACPATSRAEPDVAADADPNTGAADCFSFPTGDTTSASGCFVVGGTSLAAPLTAGMLAVFYNISDSLYGCCIRAWLQPFIYATANGAYDFPFNFYAADYHDVTIGNNGLPGFLTDTAGPAWDQATGWGSFDLFNWTRDVQVEEDAAAFGLPCTVTWSQRAGNLALGVAAGLHNTFPAAYITLSGGAGTFTVRGATVEDCFFPGTQFATAIVTGTVSTTSINGPVAVGDDIEVDLTVNNAGQSVAVVNDVTLGTTVATLSTAFNPFSSSINIADH